MIHLFKNNAGKFEIAVVNNGKYIVGSRQGYNRKAGALTAIRSILSQFVARTCVFQDDTLENPKVFIMKYDKTVRELTNVKPKKRYAPAVPAIGNSYAVGDYGSGLSKMVDAKKASRP